MDEWFFEMQENDGSICDSCGKSCDDCDLFSIDMICEVTLCRHCINVLYAIAQSTPTSKRTMKVIRNSDDKNNKEE